jgi:hypothetical protein
MPGRSFLEPSAVGEMARSSPGSFTARRPACDRGVADPTLGEERQGVGPTRYDVKARRSSVIPRPRGRSIGLVNRCWPPAAAKRRSPSGEQAFFHPFDQKDLLSPLDRIPANAPASPNSSQGLARRRRSRRECGHRRLRSDGCLIVGLYNERRRQHGERRARMATQTNGRSCRRRPLPGPPPRE